jgi:hypothetical protein
MYLCYGTLYFSWYCIADYSVNPNHLLRYLILNSLMDVRMCSINTSSIIDYKINVRVGFELRRKGSRCVAQKLRSVISFARIRLK